MPQTLRTDVRGGNGTGLCRRRVTKTVVAFLAALATLFTPAAVSSASAASAPAGFAGISDWTWPSTEQAKGLGADQVGTFRASLAWDWVEHTQGVRQWGGVDKLMADASANGYELVLVLNGCAAWACGQTRVAPSTDTQRAQYMDFLAEAARRYGTGGTYWAQSKVAPVRVNWQIWNEVNVGADWPNPTTAGYQQLLEQANATIKAVDPSARTITAGLAELPAVASGATLYNFLTGLEAQPGFKGAADVVAVHGYANDPAGTARILDTAKRIMAAAGDTRPLWVTELGWGTGGPPHAFAVTREVQAAYLRATYDQMVACRSRWGLEKAIWFALKDVTSAQLGEADYWGMNTGLYDAAGAPKPSLDAFREFTGGKEIPGGRAASCGLAGGADPAAVGSDKAPVATVVKVPSLVGKDTPAAVDFVTDMGSKGHAECSLDDGAWSTCATPYVVPKNTREGGHTLKIRAVNDAGRASDAPAVATWTLDLTAPKTVFKKTPRKRVKRIVAAQFGTRAVRLSAGGSEIVSFQCSLNKAKWRKCSAKYRQKAKRVGKQTLRVRAVDLAGNVDTRGATAKFFVAKLGK